jgi:hypothetical protein
LRMRTSCQGLTQRPNGNKDVLAGMDGGAEWGGGGEWSRGVGGGGVTTE